MLTARTLRMRLAADPRLARIVHGGASALAGRGLAIVVNAILLPLTLRYLGPLEFGVWVTISTSVLMFSVLDFGIANSLTNLIAEAHAEEDREKAAHFYVTAFWITTGVVVLAAPVLYVVWREANWAKAFHLVDPLHVRHAAACVLIAAAFSLISLPLTLANKLLAGFQQVHVANYFAMANSSLSLIAIAGTVLAQGTVVHLMAAYCVSLLVGTICLNLWIWFRQRPWLRPALSHFRGKVVRRIFGQGLLFFVIQCTGLVVFASDNLVIAHYLGPAQVTPYSFAWRLTSYAAMLQTIFLPSLWPAFSEAYYKRQLDWVRSTYRSVTRNCLLAVGAAALLIGLTGRMVIRVWAGASAVPDGELLWLMAGFNLLMAVTTNQAFLLNATGRIKLEATAAVLAAGLNIGLSIFLVQRIGAEGVILSTIISFAVFMVVPQHIETRRVLRGKYLTSELHPNDRPAANFGATAAEYQDAVPIDPEVSEPTQVDLSRALKKFQT